MLFEDKKFLLTLNTMQVAYQVHKEFVLALMVLLPLEMIFVLSNNYYWGLHEDKFVHIVTKPYVYISLKDLILT
jgi:hypothetical protein